VYVEPGGRRVPKKRGWKEGRWKGLSCRHVYSSARLVENHPREVTGLGFKIVSWAIAWIEK